MSNRESLPQIDDASVSLVYEVTAAIQEEVGMAEAFASQIAEAITRGLRRRLGGNHVYVPKFNGMQEKRDRDATIKREFNGQNRDELMRRYGLSKTQIYEIAKK
jgi:Mor family transcriptional regulator